MAIAIDEFRRHAEKRIDHLGPEDICQYQVALVDDKKLVVGTVALRVPSVSSIQGLNCAAWIVRVDCGRQVRREIPPNQNLLEILRF
jgi:hypothetical protein